MLLLKYRFPSSHTHWGCTGCCQPIREPRAARRQSEAELVSLTPSLLHSTHTTHSRHYKPDLLNFSYWRTLQFWGHANKMQKCACNCYIHKLAIKTMHAGPSKFHVNLSEQLTRTLLCLFWLRQEPKLSWFSLGLLSVSQHDNML